MTWSEIAPVAWPVIVLQLILQVAAVIDILRREPERVRGGKRWKWVVASLVFGMFGSLAYFLFGRQE